MNRLDVAVDGEMMELPVAQFTRDVFLGVVDPLDFFLVHFLESDQVSLRERLRIHAVFFFRVGL